MSVNGTYSNFVVVRPTLQNPKIFYNDIKQIKWENYHIWEAVTSTFFIFNGSTSVNRLIDESYNQHHYRQICCSWVKVSYIHIFKLEYLLLFYRLIKFWHLGDIYCINISLKATQFTLYTPYFLYSLVVRQYTVYSHHQCAVCFIASRDGRHHFCLAGEEAEMRNVNER